MRRSKRMLGVFVVTAVLSICPPAESFILINEFLADPPTGINGDANHDGIGSSTQDEFVELFNSSTETVNLSGWQISDALRVRHVFTAGSLLLPWEYIAVFGGGAPNLPGVKWQKASTGALSLNNDTDVITLFDGSSTLVDRVLYGSIANHDQSIVRIGTQLFLHSQLSESSGKLFSPGTSVDGQRTQEAPVPELPTLLYALLSGLAFLRKK